MALEIEIKPEHIDEMVRSAIMSAGLGKMINDMLGAALRSGSYNNPVENALRSAVQSIAADLIETRFKESITGAVTVMVEKIVTKEAIDAMAEAASKQLIRALNDRY
jgi:hypothetical protein